MPASDYQKVRVSLPPEGWALVVILGFVTVCSVLRNVNLLVVVSGMMFMSILLCWRLSRQAVRNVVVERIPPNRMHAGQRAELQWKAVNWGATALFQLKVSDQFRQVFSRFGEIEKSRRSANKSTGQVLFQRIDLNATSHSSYQVFFAERGVYEFGPAVVESKYPLALVKSWFKIRTKSRIHVAPRLGQLDPAWQKKISWESDASALQTAIQGAQEVDFFAVREWRSGDQQRKIHWRATAKHQQPMVKQFDKRVDQDIRLV
ncbi:MAG: DUF58 domain-containing protein, partial [Planctomycetota bacterium]